MAMKTGKGEGRKAVEQRKRKQAVNTLPIYVALAIMFVAYFLLQASEAIAIILGAAIFFTIMVLLAIELTNGIKEEGFSRNAIEIVIAVVAVLVFWFILKAVLHTQYPLDVVPSCSMLPTLQRGDMILLQGANQTSINAPIVNVNATQWNASFSSTATEAIECVAYNVSGGRLRIQQELQPGFTVGLLRNAGQYAQIVPYQFQDNLSVKFLCGEVNVTTPNGTVRYASTVGISIGNRTINGDANNSVVVYQTNPKDTFYKEGDSYIVHRVYAIANVSGKYYVLTKGDNNPGLDVQYGNLPINMSSVGGKVIASIPLLGYFKLILSNSFSEPAGCNTTIQNR